MPISRREAFRQTGAGLVTAKLGLLALACAPESVNEWPTHNSRNFPYSIRYPKGWHAEDFYPMRGSFDVFFPDTNDPHKTSVSVDMRRQEPGETLAHAVRRTHEGGIKDMQTAGDLVGRARVIDPPVNQDPNGLAASVRYDAHHFLVEYPDMNPLVLQNVVMFIAEGKVWHVILLTHEGETSRQIPTFKKMLASFTPRKVGWNVGVA